MKNAKKIGYNNVDKNIINDILKGLGNTSAYDDTAVLNEIDLIKQNLVNKDDLTTFLNGKTGFITTSMLDTQLQNDLNKALKAVSGSSGNISESDFSSTLSQKWTELNQKAEDAKTTSESFDDSIKKIQKDITEVNKNITDHLADYADTKNELTSTTERSQSNESKINAVDTESIFNAISNVKKVNEPYGKNIKVSASGYMKGYPAIAYVDAAGNSDDAQSYASHSINPYDSWNIITAEKNGDNQDLRNEEHNTARNSVYYDKENNAVVINNSNSNIFVGIMSNSGYCKNYTVTYSIDQTVLKDKATENSDGIGFILNKMTDNNGKTHILVLWRIGNPAYGKNSSLVLGYDLFSPSSINWENGYVLASGKAMNNIAWNNNKTLVRIDKNDSTIRAYTAEPGAASIDNASMLYYTFPEFKPGDMDSMTYQNVKQLISGTTHQGFCNIGQKTAIKTISSTGLTESKIFYNLDDGYVHIFNADGSEKTKYDFSDDEVVSPETIIYSAYDKKMYYYIYPGSYRCINDVYVTDINILNNELTITKSDGTTKTVALPQSN